MQFFTSFNELAASQTQLGMSVFNDRAPNHMFNSDNMDNIDMSPEAIQKMKDERDALERARNSVTLRLNDRGKLQQRYQELTELIERAEQANKDKEFEKRRAAPTTYAPPTMSAGELKKRPDDTRGDNGASFHTRNDIKVE